MDNLIAPEDGRVVAQQRSQDIKGIVLSANREPLPGVAIMIKGTTRGTTTNDKGAFELKNIPADAILVFNLTGYQQEEVSVAGVKSGTLTIQLKEKTTKLQGAL